MQDSKRKEQCPLCRGYELSAIPCPQCLGKGYILRWVKDGENENQN